RDANLAEILSRFRVLPGRSQGPALGYYRELSGEAPEDRSEITTAPLGRPLNVLDVQAIWGHSSSIFGGSRAEIELGDVLLDGYLPLKIFEQTRANLEERFSRILTMEEPYDLHRYFNHHDFRIAV